MMLLPDVGGIGVFGQKKSPGESRGLYLRKIEQKVGSSCTLKSIQKVEKRLISWVAAIFLQNVAA